MGVRLNPIEIKKSWMKCQCKDIQNYTNQNIYHVKLNIQAKSILVLVMNKL